MILRTEAKLVLREPIGIGFSIVLPLVLIGVFGLPDAARQPDPNLDGKIPIDTARVLVLTTYGDDGDVLAAIDAGATGYLLKDAPREELLRGVRAAARGESVLSPSVAATVLRRVRAPEPETPLSPRELEVLTLVAQGATNREAAARLFISEATVKTHLLHVYAKLGVNDRAAAVAAGYERGLLGTTS